MSPGKPEEAKITTRDTYKNNLIDDLLGQLPISRMTGQVPGRLSRRIVLRRLARLPGLVIRRPGGVVHFVCWWSLGSVPASLTMVHGRSKSKKLPVPPLEIADCVAGLNSRIADCSELTAREPEVREIHANHRHALRRTGGDHCRRATMPCANTWRGPGEGAGRGRELA